MFVIREILYAHPVVFCVYESDPRKVNSAFGLMTVTNELRKPGI